MFFTLEGSTSMIRRKGSRENSVATPVQCSSPPSSGLPVRGVCSFSVISLCAFCGSFGRRMATPNSVGRHAGRASTKTPSSSGTAEPFSSD